MSGENGGYELAEWRPASASPSWLVGGDAERDRLLDMDRRLRPVRLRTFAVLALALALVAPWVGWWTLAPLLLVAVLFSIAERRIGSSKHPEFWMMAAWAGAEVTIAASLLVTGDAAPTMLSLLAIPVVTLSARFSERGVWVGVAFAAALVVAVGLAADADAILSDPPLLTVPLAIVIAVAMLSTPLRASDVEHRGKAGIDTLTGLLNRASLETRIAELQEQSALTRQPVGVVVLDVDEFKGVNDREGHLAGDCVLVEVAEVLRSKLRAFDAAYRPGGDEFVVLVPGAGIEGAQRVGVELHSAINVVLRNGSGVTVSCGASASAPGEVFRFDRVFGSADQALYRAKAGDGFASAPSVKVEHFGGPT